MLHLLLESVVLEFDHYLTIIIGFILCWGMNVQDNDMTPATS
jgi:hypothetical protein